MRSVILFLCLSIGAWAQAGTTQAGPQRGGVAGPGQQQQQPPPVSDCAVAGKVLNAATGEPLNKARLTLQEVFTSPSGGRQMLASYTTTSDSEGKFTMAEIPPGNYRLRAERNGFVTMNYGARRGMRTGTTLALVQGQRLTGLEFELEPHAVITGRVVDDDGEPVVWAQVNAAQYRFWEASRRLIAAASDTTDDLGAYRIFGLQPGRYYISAMDASSRHRMQAEDRSPNRRVDEAYVTTYYPGTTDIDSAIPVEVAGGMQLQEVNLELSRARTVRVRGRVINETGVNDFPVMVMLRSLDSMRSAMSQARVDTESRFELRGLMPGRYTIHAIVRDGTAAYSGQAKLEVGTRDLENVVVRVSKGVDLEGSVRVEGASNESLSNLRVTLRPAESGPMFGGPTMGRVDADGRFVLENVGPQAYRVLIPGVPAGYYVKSMRMGREDVRENPLDVSRAIGGSLEIVLGNNAGQIEGVVVGDDGKPFPGATVVLIPDSESRRQKETFYKTATTDQAGRYSFSSLEPGSYRIYAWEDIEWGEWMDPGLQHSARTKGTTVRIQEGSQENLELKVIAAGS